MREEPSNGQSVQLASTDLAVRTSANASPVIKPANPSTAPTNDPIPPAQPFRFMSLPAELRLHIYECLLLDRATYIVPIERLPPARPLTDRQPFHPAILRACKAVYHEALPVLYGGNTWMIRTFPSKWCSKELTAYIGQRNAGLIRRVLTVAKIDSKLDEEIIRRKYEAMGIKWDQLNLWGARLNGDDTVEEVEQWLAENGAWVDKVEGHQELRRVGIYETIWFEQKNESDHRYHGVLWIIRKGSTGRRKDADGVFS